MAETDTSSYLKPAALPAQKTLLDQVGQYQQLESQKLGISQQKLKLMNDHFQVMNAELANMANDPSITPQDAMLRLNNISKTLGTPEPVKQQMLNEYSVLKTPEQVRQQAALSLKRGMAVQEKINNLYGAPGIVDTGQTIQPVNTSPMTGMRPTGLPIQKQIPPTQPVLGPDNQPTLQGPTPAIAAPGTVTTPTPVMPMRPTALPVGPRPSAGITGPSANFGGNVLGANVEAPTFNDRYSAAFPAPSGPRTGFAPGVVEAENEAGGKSGQHLANERAASAAYQRDVFPLQQAIPALEKLGAKGTGPGTETINHLKSFILSNVPGITEKDPAFASVPTFDKARKYLTDFVNQTGNSGTNDKLAAAFAGNPSVNISNAAAVDVAKAAYALRNVRQAQYLEFEQSGQPASNFSKWVAQRQHEIDPRAFGVDMMNDDAKKKLLGELNKNKREKQLFEKSLELAHRLGFITPK